MKTIHDSEVAGFALYSELPSQGIYLEGIAISRWHQGKGGGWR